METLVINEKDILSNLEKVRKYARVQLIGVIDQNGYGCGRRYLTKVLVSAGVQTLAASDADTVNAILDEFPQVNVLLLCPVFGREELACVINRGAIATVDDVSDVVRLNAAAEEMDTMVRVHLLIRTHKNGCGLSLSQVDRMAKVLHACRNIEVDGAYTHLDPAGVSREKAVMRQKALFDATVEKLTAAGIAIPLLHMADGYSSLRYPSIGYNAVRVGEAVIGRLEGKDRWNLTPVGMLETAVIERTTIYAEEEKALKGKEKQCCVSLIASREAVMKNWPGRFPLLKNRRIFCTGNGKKYAVTGWCGKELFFVDAGRNGLKAGDVLCFDADPRLVVGGVKREYR